MSIDSKLNEIQNIKQQCQSKASQLQSCGYFDGSLTMQAELQAIDVELAKIDQILNKAIIKAQKVKVKWMV